MSEQASIRDALQKPYWAADDELPAWDFCREIVEPGENEAFPDGAVGLRVDDDFWAVAALPYSYRSWTCEALVKNLWPNELRAQFYADSGTFEQASEKYAALMRSYNSLNRVLNQRIFELERQLRQSQPVPRESLKGECNDQTPDR